MQPCIVAIVLLFRVHWVESFIGGQLCLQASTAFAKTTTTNGVEKLRYSWLKTKFSSWMVFCFAASHDAQFE